MAHWHLAAVIVLLCGIASRCSGESTLTVGNEIGDDGDDDLACIVARWNPIRCLANGTLSAVATNGARSKKFNVEEDQTGFRFWVDYWTNYTVRLESNCPGYEAKETTHYTGPGKPLKVSGIETSPSTTHVEVTIREAFMPKSVDRYIATLCSSENGCETKNFERTGRVETKSRFELKFDELRAATQYNLTIAPEITYEGRTYRGKESWKTFATKLDSPAITVIKRTRDSLKFKATPSLWTMNSPELFFILKTASNRTYNSSSGDFEVRNLKPYHNETVEVSVCYDIEWCSNPVSIVARTSAAAPARLGRLIGAVVNQTSLLFLWKPPVSPNGPLDGYYVVLSKLANSTPLLRKVLAPTQTLLEYPSNEELETFVFSVRAFNFDDDNEHLPLFSKVTSVTVRSFKQ